MFMGLATWPLTTKSGVLPWEDLHPAPDIFVTVAVSFFFLFLLKTYSFYARISVDLLHIFKLYSTPTYNRCSEFEIDLNTPTCTTEQIYTPARGLNTLSCCQFLTFKSKLNSHFI